MKLKNVLFFGLLVGLLMATQSAFSGQSQRVAQVDRITGKIFNADGKEWHVGPYNITWNETQKWIKSLGDGWRTPTLAEMESLYFAEGHQSPLGNRWTVWAERKSSSSAWTIHFRYGSTNSTSTNFRDKGCRALAVR